MPELPSYTHDDLSEEVVEKIYGVCHMSSVPIRARPSNRGQMVSQLLFGETFEVLEEEERWVKIQCTWDKSKGWINNQQFQEITEERLERIQQQPAYSLEITQPALSRDYYLPLLMGSTLPNYDGINFRLNDTRYTYSGQAVLPHLLTPSADLAIRIARKYLYAPELPGGRSPFGIDASGFAQMIFKLMNIKIARTPARQALRGKVVHFVSEARPGDLAFFENERNKVHHVGMIMPDLEIIHVAGQVRIDRLDHYGIFNTVSKRYTHKLRVVKRILL